MRRRRQAESVGASLPKVGNGPDARTVGVLSALIALFVALLFAAPVRAADQSFQFSGSFASEGSGDGELTHPRRVAVEDSTGNVLVVDRDNGRVQVFEPTAEAAEYLTQFGAGTLEAPFGIAIDQSSDAVYVSDADAEEIFRFESDGAPTPTYTLDGSFTSPAKGSGAGQIGSFEADLAIDPTSGDLVVADAANNRVSRYAADGTFDSSFDGSDSPDGAFTGLLDLDVAPNGEILVVDSEGPVFVEGEEVGSGGPETCVQNYYCNGAPSRVLRFDSAGAYLTQVMPLAVTTAGLVAVDPNNLQVLVGLVNPQGSVKFRIYAPDASRRIDEFGLPYFFTWMPAIAIGGSGRMYAVTDQMAHQNYGGTVGEVSVKAFDPVTLPEVAIDPVGTVTTTTAHVSGEVNPSGAPTSWVFEYRPVGSEDWTSGPGGDAGSGTTADAVSAELTGLEPNTDYEVRLTATGAASKQSFSAAQAFKTAVALPVVTTRDASPRTTDSARLNGYINARNAATTYHFEWGPTAAYGNSAPAAEDGAAGSGGGQILASEEIAGLQPGTTYHFRLVATNGAGTVTGEDRTFSTRTALEMLLPQRGIELVNSPDKGNQNPTGYFTNVGENVVWTTMTGSPGSPQGKAAAFLAEREAQGWRSRSLLPPPQDLIEGGELAYTMVAASADYSKVIFRVGEDANMGITGDPYYYVRYDRTTGEQKLLDYLPNGGLDVDREEGIFRVSSDARHVYTMIREQPEVGVSQLYDVGAGTRHPVGVLPETGQPPVCGTTFAKQVQVMSEDGHRFYFLTRGDNCSDPLKIYAYDNQGTDGAGDDTVTRVSTEPVAGPEGDAYPIRVSPSGDRIAYHTTAKITAEDSNEATDIYVWEIGEGSRCITCVVADPGIAVGAYGWSENLLVSRDLSRIYLVSEKPLVPGMGAGHPSNLYVFRGGEVHYISPLSPGLSYTIREHAEATPNGRVLTFVSDSAGISSDAGGGVAQVFRYSEDDGSVECMSCPVGGAAASDIAGPPTRPFLIFLQPPIEAEARGLTWDGSTYAFKTNEALVPEDANGGPDVYEWHNGAIELITDGEGEYGGNVSVPLNLEGITRDGTDILFRVSAQLTGFERDEVGQLFAARIGGGFPPPRPPAVCREDACQGPLDQAPAFTQPASSSAGGNGQATATRKKAQRKKAKCKPTKRGAKTTKAKKCGKKKSGKQQGKRNRGAGRNRGGK